MEAERVGREFREKADKFSRKLGHKQEILRRVHRAIEALANGKLTSHSLDLLNRSW